MLVDSIFRYILLSSLAELSITYLHVKQGIDLMSAPLRASTSRGPVDVEQQCGATLPNGAQCSRNLTCKRHSMAAKRAVAGRSMPYDMLLVAYQKRNPSREDST